MDDRARFERIVNQRVHRSGTPVHLAGIDLRHRQQRPYHDKVRVQQIKLPLHTESRGVHLVKMEIGVPHRGVLETKPGGINGAQRNVAVIPEWSSLVGQPAPGSIELQRAIGRPGPGTRLCLVPGQLLLVLSAQRPFPQTNCGGQVQLRPPERVGIILSGDHGDIELEPTCDFPQASGRRCAGRLVDGRESLGQAVTQATFLWRNHGRAKPALALGYLRNH